MSSFVQALASDALDGRRILVTRPIAQARSLSELILAHGGVPVLFPLLEIRAPASYDELDAVCGRLESFDIAFFVSVNAVTRSLDYLFARRDWPETLAAATVGRASTEALRRYGFVDAFSPDSGYDSESVLALPIFSPEAVAGRKVLIFRGNGGRDLLGDELRARQATVEYVSCYRRGLPENATLSGLAKLVGDGGLDAITLTSSEAVRYFVALLGQNGIRNLSGTPVFAPHARIVECVSRAGFSPVFMTEPGDQGLLKGLASHLLTSLG